MSPTQENLTDIGLLCGLVLVIYLTVKIKTWWQTPSTRTRFIPQPEDEIQADIGVEGHAPGAHVTPKSHEPGHGLGAGHRFNQMIGYPPDRPQS